MTDDIVTRLREVCMCKGITCPHDGINDDAADEIERLRNDVKVRDLQILANFKAMDAMHKELYGDAE
jgi:hypothetical protein